jgi:hypothetical protein
MPDIPEFYYRKVRGVWHILSWQRGGSDGLALCREGCLDASEGYAPTRGRRDDPADVCSFCRTIADGAKQLTLLEVA